MVTLKLQKNSEAENKTYAVEESGYQSHETGTDSLCSSTRSTDQEDTQMFSPTSTASLKNNGSRNKVCRVRNARRDPKLIPVTTVHSKSSSSKSLRRSRYDSRVPSDIRPSESSLEDGSSRDSIKLIVRTKPKNKKRDGVAENSHSSKSHSLHNFKSKETSLRSSGMQSI